MKVYFYDVNTKEFISEGNAFKDPKASDRLGKDVWLLPANATFDEPLETKEEYAVVYDNGWRYVKDYRQKEAVNANGIFSVDYLGEIREGDLLISDEQKQLIENGELVFSNGQLTEKSREQKEADKRLERNILLQSTDKYMLSDYPLTEEERELYRQYRQYLRDFPENDDFGNSEIKTFEIWKGA